MRPALAPQVQFDPDTGRIIIDDSTLTHVRQNPSNRAAGTLGRAVAEGESTVTSASCECLLFVLRRYRIGLRRIGYHRGLSNISTAI